MTRGIPWLIGVLVLTGCRGDQADEPAVGRPNVLVILVDDLRPDLGVYGHPIVQTPAIDDLAGRGVRFTRAYAQAPVCNPSRASLLTGLRPASTGVFDNRTSLASTLPKAVTLPGLFAREGYFTASIGKIYHGSGRKGAWTDSASWDLEFTPPYGRPKGKAGKAKAEEGRVGRYRWQAVPGDESRFPDVRTARRAISVLEESRSEPFFMMVGLTGTHPHFEVPARFFTAYPLDEIPLRTLAESGSRNASYATQGWSDQQDGRFSDRQRRELTRAYWACVSYVDEQVGEILAALDRLGLDDSTVIVLTSDHGYHLGEHDWWSKHTLFEVATRVPLIIATPDSGVAGSTASGLVELIDVFPTLTELIGAEPPPELEGRSLVPLLNDPTREGKRAAFSQMKIGGIRGASIRTDGWRYTEWKNGSRGVELYDHSVDPDELHNLAGEKDLRQTQARLRRRLRSKLSGGGQ
jgi:iduronate 2-sulfatase